MVVDCILCSDGDSRRFFSLRKFAWDCLSGRIFVSEILEGFDSDFYIVCGSNCIC